MDNSQTHGSKLNLHCEQADFINSINHEQLTGNAASKVFTFNTLDYNSFLEDFSALLSPEETERAGKFHFEKDRLNYIICHGITRIILAKDLGAQPSGLIFRKETNGKPYIPDCKLNFNLSHAKSFCALVISELDNVGCDIEIRKEQLNYEAIISKFFSPVEQNYIRSSSDPIDTFFTFWTRKEAILKATGKGITTHLGNFSVIDGVNVFEKLYVSLEQNNLTVSDYYIYTDKSGDQTISIATPQPCNISSAIYKHGNFIA